MALSLRRDEAGLAKEGPVEGGNIVAPSSARVLAARPKVLDPGIKHVTFKAPQHFPHDVRVDLPPGTTTIKMKLRPIPK